MTPGSKRSGSNIEKLTNSDDPSSSLDSVQVNELAQEPTFGTFPWKASRTPVEYSMDYITGVSNLADLEKLFSDPFNTLMLKFPSEMIPKARFTCDSSSVFAYEVRESFMELLGMVQNLIAGKFTSDSFE